MSDCGALLNLVRLNPLDETFDNEYTGGEVTERHDEIRLVDPSGNPCAIPTPASYQNLDYTYTSISGDQGHQQRIITRNLSLNLDYIDAEVATKLEQWKHERARVLVCPGFGRSSVFAWRPFYMAGAAYPSGGVAYDLTGTHAMEIDGETGIFLWDETLGAFLPESGGNTVQFTRTPGGAGYGQPRTPVNRMIPSYPQGAGQGGGAGNSGWTKGDTDFADITFTINSGGFGHPDCPDSLVVDVVPNTSASRSIYAQSIWDSGHGGYQGYSFTGSGTAVVVLWLKGRLPDNASLQLTGGASVDISKDLSDTYFPGWTPVIVGEYDTDWSASVPRVKLHLKSTTDTSARFEVGPCLVAQWAGVHANAGPWWCDGNNGNVVPLTKTVSPVPFPDSGAIISSFYLPESWFNDASTYMDATLVGSPFMGLDLFRSGGITGVAFRGASSTYSEQGASELVVVGVNTAAFVWCNGYERLFINGEPIGTADRGAYDLDLGVAGTMRVGGGGYASRGCYPVQVLTARIDEGRYTNAEIKNIHLALTDPIALTFAMKARGRVFQITDVPQTLRASAGGSDILGSLKLRQVQYQHHRADPLNREENRP